MSPVPTIAFTLIATPSASLPLVTTPSPQTANHVIIDNLSKPSDQGNTLVIAVIVAIITALLTWFFQWIHYRVMKEDEREKLYEPLRLYLTTLRSIDKHLAGIEQVGDEADEYNIKIHDDGTSIEELKKSIHTRLKYLNKAVEKWHDYLGKIYELFQSNPGLIKKEHHKTVDRFIDAYITSHYFDNQSPFDINDLNAFKYYFDKKTIPYIKNAVHELEKTILGSQSIDVSSFK